MLHISTRQFFSVLVLGLFLLAIAHPTWAAVAGPKGFFGGLETLRDKVVAGGGVAPSTLGDPIGGANKIIFNVIKYMLSLVAILALVAMIWASIMYILALGDEGKAEKAKNIILYAIIGIVVSGLSFVILTVIQGIISA